MNTSASPHPSERRQYVRLDHIFPVEFQICDSERRPISGWHQAFSQDIGQGGLRLTVNHLTTREAGLLKDRGTVLSLIIHIPSKSKEIQATGRPAWCEELKNEPFLQMAVGVSFDVIHQDDRRKLLAYVRVKKLFKAAALTLTLFLGLAVVMIGFQEARLRYENEQLLNNLSSFFSRAAALEKNSGRLKLQMEGLQFLLSQSERKIEKLQTQLLSVRADDRESKYRLTQALALLKRQEASLRADLSKLTTEKARAEVDVITKRKEASLLENKILDKLYQWLKLHQNRLTGLVSSYEGDAAMEDWAFTYDQALVAIAFVYSGDTAPASRILDFYLTAPVIDSGAVANAYYATSGDVAESIAHAGPNIWLGLAMMHYMDKTQDKRYLAFVKNLALWLDSLQDSDGGLKGGRTVSWYSTEHNLDAYAFYKMLARVSQDPAYEKRAQTILGWLNKNAFSRMGLPLVKRGKGDATIATDTYAWSVTAIGPEVLRAQGMNPDDIMDFAIQHCSVAVNYERMDGSVARIKGFDFAKAQHLARGGVISCEWTAQMILAMEIMAQAHTRTGDREKALMYNRLAQSYIADLSQMMITSPSPVGQGDFCLPYASHEAADTGHGWRTPQGHRTGSVAATTYTILAMRKINPLSLP